MISFICWYSFSADFIWLTLNSRNYRRWISFPTHSAYGLKIRFSIWVRLVTVCFRFGKFKTIHFESVFNPMFRSINIHQTRVHKLTQSWEKCSPRTSSTWTFENESRCIRAANRMRCDETLQILFRFICRWTCGCTSENEIAFAMHTFHAWLLFTRNRTRKETQPRVKTKFYWI